MKIITRLTGVLFFCLLMAFTSARADILLLVHGYQGSIYSWERTGVVPVLQHFGWKRAAVLIGAPGGLVPVAMPWPEAENKVISLQLDSELPVVAQSNVFAASLRWVNDRYPSEKVIIIGHSLGGLIARFSLVRDGAPNVKALITIASPHLGTAIAYRGLDEIDDSFPINMLKEFFGGSRYDTLQRSRGLLHDIVPAVPGKLLFWLNSRVHPDIKYFSIVRTSASGMLGDPIVPGYSQDMANVWPIGKKSTRYLQGFSHWLSILDGYMLINILDQIKD